MSELFEHIDKLRDAEGKVAVATLVNTRGTTPRKEGARMLVGEGGRILGSVTIGGCVDAQVIEESADVLGRNAPRLIEMNLGDEDAWEIGLTCGGTIEVFVEPVALDRPDDPALAFFERARALAEAGGRAAVVTRLDPPAGAKLLVHEDGHTEGSLGDPFLDRRSRPRRRRLPAKAGPAPSSWRGCAGSSRCGCRRRSCSWSGRATWPCRSQRSRGPSAFARS